MKVVVPHTNLHPVTKQVLESYRLPVRFVEIKDDDAYRRLLRDLWDEDETVVLVEHDVAPWPGAIEELLACPCLWGSNSYIINGGVGIYHGLGCTKISTGLMRMLPGLWNEAKHWSQLDRHLWFAARAIAQEPHPHRPPVIHLNPRATFFTEHAP